MKKVVFFLFVAMCCMALATTALADDDDFEAFDLVFDNVGLTRGASADIHVKVFVNEDDDDGVTMLAIHGYAHTAVTWEPLVKELFKEDDAVSRVIAMDLPGHGESSFPSGLSYGELILDDYVLAILNTLKRLNRLDMFPSMVIGHSQGGLLIQMLQMLPDFDLIDSGIDQAVLLAPVPPSDQAGGLPWAFIGSAGLIIGSNICPNPANQGCLDDQNLNLGLYVAFSDEVFVDFFFKFPPFSGPPVSGAPTPEEVFQKGYSAPEPLYVSLNLTGLSIPRPVVTANVFASNGTSLGVVAFERDVIVLPDEAANVYSYLTGDISESGYITVSGPEAIHDMYISDPKTVVDAICAIADLDCDDDDDDDDD